MNAEARSTYPVRWAAAGAAFGLALLAVYALVLLNSGGAGWKVLIAVWLAAWPVLLAGGLAGYALGKLARGVRSTPL